jgi:hypothetical protein
MLRTTRSTAAIFGRVSTNESSPQSETAEPKRWGQVDLALVELARMNREIATFRPTVRDDDDREHLASLEACRAALLRLVARELQIADV